MFRQLYASDRDAASNFSVPHTFPPASGIVWSVINSGQYVRAGDEIARVIDLLRAFGKCDGFRRANMLLSRMEIRGPVFRQQDQEHPLKGTVAWAGVPAIERIGCLDFRQRVAPGLNNLQYSVTVALDDGCRMQTNCPAGQIRARSFFENTRAL